MVRNLLMMSVCYIILAVLLCKSVVCEFKYLNDGDGVVMNDESNE